MMAEELVQGRAIEQQTTEAASHERRTGTLALGCGSPAVNVTKRDWSPRAGPGRTCLRAPLILMTDRASWPPRLYNSTGFGKNWVSRANVSDGRGSGGGHSK